MSVGRIELVNGKKTYVRYATLGGGTITPPPSYDPILANNSWAQIDEASRSGKAKELWNLGDIKDGYMIIGFDHDDLADGTGKAGITFICNSTNMNQVTHWGAWSDSTSYLIPVRYDESNICKELEDVYNGTSQSIILKQEIRDIIKPVKKAIRRDLKNMSVSDVDYIDCKLFLLSYKEIEGDLTPKPYDMEGTQYIGVKDYEYVWWTRTNFTTQGGDFGVVYAYKGQEAETSSWKLEHWIRYAFCI